MNTNEIPALQRVIRLSNEVLIESTTSVTAGGHIKTTSSIRPVRAPPPPPPGARGNGTSLKTASAYSHITHIIWNCLTRSRP